MHGADMTTPSADRDNYEPWKVLKDDYGPTEKKQDILKIMIPVSVLGGWIKGLFGKDKK